MKILGLSAFYHDSAACLISDGEIIAAVQEERFTRKKHDSSFPVNSIKYCLDEANIRANNIDYIVFYDKPFLKFERLFETYLAFAPRGFKGFITSLPVWLKDKLFQKSLLVDSFKEAFGNSCDWSEKLMFSEHHLSHAGSAFFPSPFEDAAVLTMDGVGEWTTTSLATGSGNTLVIDKEIHFPHSLGLLYSAFTYYTGFKVNSGEYKMMGLAPYGEPKYVDLIKDNLIDVKQDGSFHLNMKYFGYCTDLKMTNSNFEELFGAPARNPESILTQKDMDIAASIQEVAEEIVIKLATDIQRSTGQKNLCLAGGVALNCVANGKILRQNIFDKIWVQPAAGDAGGAIGAALCAYYMMLKNPRLVQTPDSMKGSYLGPKFSQQDIEVRLNAIGAKFASMTQDQMLTVVARALDEGKAVGWFQDRMEFGPRSLGARSIIADPRSPDAQKKLNMKVKYRESFRPFAPSILCEDIADWFDITSESPYMLMVADIIKDKQYPMTDYQHSLFGIEKLNVVRSVIPAVTHVDYSARIQTVHKNTNPKFHELISKFKDLSGCPVIVNTSFNIRGEPIVNTPEDAFNCFMGTGIDVLAIGNCVLLKIDQDPSLARDYKNTYELD